MTFTQRSVVVLASAFFLAVAFQTVQVVRERSYLDVVRAGQDAPVQEAQQILAETEALAGETAALADKGDAGAKQVVDALGRQGINLHAPQQASAAEKPPAPAKP